MQKYIIQRAILMIPTVILITVLTFLLLRVFLPTDVVDLIIGEYGVNDPTLKETIEENLGLSGNVFGQYAEWTGISWFWGGESGVLQGDLGESLHSGRPIMSELKRRIPVSLELGLWAQFTAIVVSVPLGVLAAVRQDKWQDYGLRSAAILINSVPNFWVAVLIITLGSIWFNWAPPIRFAYLFEDPVQHLKIMLLPGVIIGLTPSGGLIRVVRTQMLEVLRQDYVRTAHAKGLSPRTVFYRHALRNALIPVVTVVGVTLPSVISGTVIFEQIFILPGMGKYLVDSVGGLDYPVIMALNLMFALLLMVTVLIVDISYAWLDPRIRYR